MLDLLGKTGDNVSTQQLRIVTGEGLGGLESEREALNIHEENLQKLRSMTQEEILQEQRRLLVQLGMNTSMLHMNTLLLIPGWRRVEEM